MCCFDPRGVPIRYIGAERVQKREVSYVAAERDLEHVGPIEIAKLSSLWINY